MSLKALILDDDPVMLGILQKMLQVRGYQVTAYSNPAICPLFTSRTCPCNNDKTCPDVIVTDLVMATVSGTEFVEELKRKGCKCNHIALISGLWTETSLKKASALGVKVLNKPFQPELLEEWLADVQKMLPGTSSVG